VDQISEGGARIVYANTVKPLCKIEKMQYFSPLQQNGGENSQIKRHRSAKAAKF